MDTDVLDVVEKSTRFVKEATDRLGRVEADRRAYEALIPDAVDSLVDTGMLPEKYRSKLAASLKESPEEALRCIATIAKKASNGKVAVYGRPADADMTYHERPTSIWDEVAKSKSGWGL